MNIKKHLSEVIRNPDNRNTLKSIMNATEENLNSHLLRLQQAAAKIESIFLNFPAAIAENVPEPEPEPVLDPIAETVKEEEE